MKIYRPIKSNYRTQGFGENSACIELRTGKVITKTGNTCPAGYADLYKQFAMLGHNGEDWAIWRGEPVYFPVDVSKGITFRAKTEVDNSGGIGVNVISNQVVKYGQYEGYIKFKFWHLKKVAVFDGQEIEFGKLLGYGNSTGLSSADHLHWSMKPCDKDGKPLLPSNGYTGAVDFRPWFENTFVLDVVDKKDELVEQIIVHQMTALELIRKIVFEIVMRINPR